MSNPITTFRESTAIRQNSDRLLAVLGKNKASSFVPFVLRVEFENTLTRKNAPCVGNVVHCINYR